MNDESKRNDEMMNQKKLNFKLKIEIVAQESKKFENIPETARIKD